MKNHKLAVNNNKLYRQWKSMRYKCTQKTNRMYHNYGAKGITYYEPWNSFECFCSWSLSNGYSEEKTLARYDEDGNFSPDNCFWIEKGTHHGKSQTRIYTIWHIMKLRCNCPSHKSYKDYGGRGITYCKEWSNFLEFERWAVSNGYADNLTIDRIDVNGNYEPSNCRWSDAETQCNNRRNNHLITFNGTTKTMSQWARELNISRNAILQRIKRGLPIEEVLRTKKHCHRGENHFQNLITFNGITLNQKQWAEKIGISPMSLCRRLKTMSIEEALTKKRTR